MQHTREHRSDREAAGIDAARARVPPGWTIRRAVAAIPNIAAIDLSARRAGAFQPADAAFAGATLSWDVFEWGRTLDALRKRRRERNRRLALDATDARIAFDIARGRLDLDAAYEMLAVGASICAAEEAHRIQSVRYEQGDATTTDVLDAETELARARLADASARYDYYIAIVSLARAEGRLPTELMTGEETRDDDGSN